MAVVMMVRFMGRHVMVMMHHVVMMVVVMNRRVGVSGDGRRGETDNQGRRNQQFLKHPLSP